MTWQVPQHAVALDTQPLQTSIPSPDASTGSGLAGGAVAMCLIKAMRDIGANAGKVGNLNITSEVLAGLLHAGPGDAS